MVIGLAQAVCQCVEQHVAGAGVEGQAGALVVVGNIGDASQVNTIIVVAEKQLVADRHERCALPAQRNVEGAEVADYRQVGMRRQVGTVAQLQGDVLVGLVEDRMSVRSNKIGLYSVLLYELMNPLPHEAAEGMVQLHQLQGTGGLGTPKGVN